RPASCTHALAGTPTRLPATAPRHPAVPPTRPDSPTTPAAAPPNTNMITNRPPAPTRRRSEGGVTAYLGIAGDGPSSPDYRGGLWAVNVVTFTPGTTPFLLTSAQAVLTAQSLGEV